MFQALAEIALLRLDTPTEAARCYQTKLASADQETMGKAADQAYLAAFESQLLKKANSDDLVIPLSGIGQIIGADLALGMLNNEKRRNA